MVCNAPSCSPRGSIGRVGFFLDDRAVQQLVDLPLDRCAAVVGEVDGAGVLDEGGAEVAGTLEVADIVLDLPQALVDRLQLSSQVGQGVACRYLFGQNAGQHVVFVRHVVELGRVADVGL